MIVIRRRLRLAVRALVILFLLVNLVGFVAVVSAGGPDFTRGDANGDGTVNVSDPILTYVYLIGQGPLPCHDGADSNDDGTVNVVDVVYTLGYLFRGGDDPPTPFPGCGPDPTADTLECATSACP